MYELKNWFSHFKEINFILTLSPILLNISFYMGFLVFVSVFQCVNVCIHG